MIQLDNTGYIYSPDDLASMVGVTPTSIRNYIKAGLIPATKFNGRWVITENDLDNVIKKILEEILI